ncbi:hypothetical protein [Sorangium sp. So ce1335]|uniref:hypothetical protein n=1 Tax=Sorangium sp. So ce1335 TaxID=3133335 RepID=UPI003F5F85C4
MGGTFTTTEVAEGEVAGVARRRCTVPRGKALFIPILNAACSTIQGDGETEEELRDCANDLMDQVTERFIVIDGKRIRGLDAFRHESPLFVFGPLPEDNLIGADAGETSDAVADGFHVLLAPLSPGAHTIHFGGRVETDDFTFDLDITYHLTVGH